MQGARGAGHKLQEEAFGRHYEGSRLCPGLAPAPPTHALSPPAPQALYSWTQSIEFVSILTFMRAVPIKFARRLASDSALVTI